MPSLVSIPRSFYSSTGRFRTDTRSGVRAPDHLQVLHWKHRASRYGDKGARSLRQAITLFGIRFPEFGFGLDAPARNVRHPGKRGAAQLKQLYTSSYDSLKQGSIPSYANPLSIAALPMIRNS
jgi:hypothetical protein